MHEIAPSIQSKPEYKFCRELLSLQLGILSNLLLGCKESKSYVYACYGLINTLASLVSKRAKTNFHEEWILVSVSTLVRNMYFQGSPPLSPVLVKALHDSRLNIGKGATKEALSCALWTCSAHSQVNEKSLFVFLILNLKNHPVLKFYFVLQIFVRRF